MWPREGTVLTVSSQAPGAACERLGLDTEALLRSVGIQRQRLEDPDARLQNREAGALWAKVYELPSFKNLEKDLKRSLAAIDFRTPDGQKFDSFGLNAENAAKAESNPLMKIFFGNVQKVFDGNGRLLDDAYIRRAEKFLNELIWMARVLRYGREQVPLV